MALGDLRQVEQSFEATLERARALDQAALALLYDRYLPPMYRFILGRVADQHLAEDLTAETFMAMVENIERVRADDELAFAGWLYGVARNKIAEHYRRQSTRQRLAATLPETTDVPVTTAEAGDPLAVVMAREQWSEVVAALAQLTEEQRTVVLYRCVLGYDAEEVAQMMGRQPGAVRALQFRALSSLARMLSKDASNPSWPVARDTNLRPAPGRRSQRSPDATRG